MSGEIIEFGDVFDDILDSGVGGGIVGLGAGAVGAVAGVAIANLLGPIGITILSGVMIAPAVIDKTKKVVSASKEFIKIHNDEKQFEKKLTNKIKELSLDNDSDITIYIDKIKKYAVNSGLINNENFEKSLNGKNKKDQLNTAYELFDLISKYNCLKNNIYSLNDIVSSLNVDINEILNEYELLHDIN